MTRGYNYLNYRIFNSRLLMVLEKNGLLSDCQQGFRPGHGCRDAIFVSTTMIEKAKMLGYNDFKMTFVDIKV